MAWVWFIDQPTVNDANYSVEHSHLAIVTLCVAQAPFDLDFKALFQGCFVLVECRVDTQASTVVAVDNTLEVPSGMVKKQQGEDLPC